MSRKLKDQGQNGCYRLADRPSAAEKEALGFARCDYSPEVNPFRVGHRGLVAVHTGEKRPPKRGEWYLSGALVRAYRAPSDHLDGLYHIAKLVAIETKLQVTIVAKALLPVYYDCGICDHFHPWNWNRDCRDDVNRLTYDDLDARHRENGYELRSMEERLKVDELVG